MEYIEKEDESERKKVAKPPAKKSSAPPSTPRSVLLAKTMQGRYKALPRRAARSAWQNASSSSQRAFSLLT